MRDPTWKRKGRDFEDTFEEKMATRSLRDDLESVEFLIKNHQGKMTPWELDFIDNVHDQLTSGRPLVGKQGPTLDQIWVTMIEGEK